MAETLAEDTKAASSATPEKDLRRWLLEIKLSQKREKVWRKTGREVINRYRGCEGNNGRAKKNSFNILWANTEVLRPALYNSTPKPDVRRRFRQKDALGKAVGEVSERSLSYCVDAYDLDACLKNDVLDSLLPGRGISRVRYIPKIKTVPADPAASAGAPPANDEAAGDESEAFQGMHEEVEYEQALCDHVQWDDFLHGPGKTWAEVQWVDFLCRLTKDDIEEKFGEEIAKQVTLDDVSDEEFAGKEGDEDKQAFKRALFHEIWDKESGKVFFVNESYRKGVIYPVGEKGEPPLKFKNFFPCPQPLQMFEDTGTLLPTPLYELYREQAEELDRISARINKIVNACRVRFVHDPTLTELKALMDAGDNEGIPAENARAWMTNGGIEKAIWWMPVQQIAVVLKELYVARDACTQVIYEITGLSDIIRGSTNPNETLGAQQLKANSSSMRLQRMQREVQRYVRDLIRLLAEVIGEHFSYQTLAKMTGLNFPTNLMKQQIQLQIQAGQQQLQQATVPGQPPPPIPPEIQQKLQEAQQTLSMPSWEDIKGVMSNDMSREYRVDVETDSTVAESLTKDMQGMTEVITSVVEVIQGFGPAVVAGAVKADAVKSIVMSVVRRARMGIDVEDALEEGIQEPKPANDPKAAADAAKQQQAAQEAQHAQALEQQSQAHDEAIAKQQFQHEQQIAQREALAEQQKMRDEAMAREQELIQKHAAEMEDLRVSSENELKKTALQVAGQIEIARINAGAKVAADTAKAQQDGEQKAQAKNEGDDARAIMQSLLDTQGKLLETISAPKVVDRDSSGRVIAIRAAA